MGSVLFRLPPDLSAAEQSAVAAAALAGGYDVAPAPTRAATTGNVLTLTRDASESGYLFAPWPDAHGVRTAALSATLRERPEPYDFLVELARGRVNAVRTQVADWAPSGFALPAAEARSLRDLTKRFGQAVLAGPGQGDAAAREVLLRAGPVADKVAALYAQQLLDARVAADGPLETALGVRLAQLPPADARGAIAAAFTAVRLVPSWRAIEPAESTYEWKGFDALVDWAVGAGLDVSVGPVIDLADGQFPDWVRQWDGDLPSLAAFFCDFAEGVVRRYKGKVRAWQLVAGFNHADRFGLGEDDRLRLAAKLLDAGREADPKAGSILGLAQPWGDYLASEDYTYSPLVFADTLIRAGFSFAAVDLEVLAGPAAGPGVRAPVPRDAVALARLCDLFGVLSIPLEVTLGRPLAAAGGPAVDPSVTLALALPHVRGVYWEAWAEAEADRLPGSALSGPSPGAQALKKRLRELRLRYLA